LDDYIRNRDVRVIDREFDRSLTSVEFTGLVHRGRRKMSLSFRTISTDSARVSLLMADTLRCHLELFSGSEESVSPVRMACDAS